jgi:hypothetical protein
VASIFSTSQGGAPQRASSLGLLDVGIVAMELYEKGDLNVIVDSVQPLKCYQKVKQTSILINKNIYQKNLYPSTIPSNLVSVSSESRLFTSHPLEFLVRIPSFTLFFFLLLYLRLVIFHQPSHSLDSFSRSGTPRQKLLLILLHPFPRQLFSHL